MLVCKSERQSVVELLSVHLFGLLIIANSAETRGIATVASRSRCADTGA